MSYSIDHITIGCDPLSFKNRLVCKVHKVVDLTFDDVVLYNRDKCQD